MIELLRDSAWNGISGLVAIIALIIVIRQDNSLRPIGLKIIIGLGRATIGILAISLGAMLYLGIFDPLLGGGIRAIQMTWDVIGGTPIVYSSFRYAIFPGSVTALVCSMSKNLWISTILATIVAIIGTTLADIWVAISTLGQAITVTVLLFPVLFNIVGGVIIGPVIALCVRGFDNILGVRP